MESRKVDSGSPISPYFDPKEAKPPKRKMSDGEEKTVEQARKLKKSAENQNVNNNSLSGRVKRSSYTDILENVFKSKNIAPLQEVLSKVMIEPLNRYDVEIMKLIRKDPNINTLKILFSSNLSLVAAPKSSNVIEKENKSCETHVNLEIISWKSNFFRDFLYDFSYRISGNCSQALIELMKDAIDYCYELPNPILDSKFPLEAVKEFTYILKLFIAAIYFRIDTLKIKIIFLLLRNIHNIPLEIFVETFKLSKNLDNLRVRSSSEGPEDGVELVPIFKNALIDEMQKIVFEHPIFEIPTSWFSENVKAVIDILKENMRRISIDFDRASRPSIAVAMINYLPKLEKIHLNLGEIISFSDLCWICKEIKNLKSLKELRISSYKISEDCPILTYENYEASSFDDLFSCLAENHPSLEILELSWGGFYDIESLLDKVNRILKGEKIVHKFECLKTLILNLSIPFETDYVIGCMLMFPSLETIEYTKEFRCSMESFETKYNEKFDITCSDLENQDLKIILSKNNIQRSIVLRYKGKQESPNEIRL